MQEIVEDNPDHAKRQADGRGGFRYRHRNPAAHLPAVCYYARIIMLSVRGFG